VARGYVEPVPWEYPKATASEARRNINRGLCDAFRYHSINLGDPAAIQNGTKIDGQPFMIWYHFHPRAFNQVKRKGTKMTLIKFEVDQSDADVMRMHYGQKTASKAYAMAAADVIPLYRETQELKAVIEAQRLEILRYQRIVEQARSAAALLLEKTAQGDLIN